MPVLNFMKIDSDGSALDRWCELISNATKIIFRQLPKEPKRFWEVGQFYVPRLLDEVD